MKGRPTVLIAVLAVLAGATSSARADSATALPLVGFSTMVVDEASQNVFVTGEPGSNGSFVATDLAGTVVHTFTNEPGAAGMVVDHGTLFVARCGSAAIDTFDTSLLSKTGSITLPEPLAAPCELAIAGGRLWCTTSALASVSLDAAHTVVTSGASVGHLLRVPAAPNDLAVLDSYGSLAVYDVSTAPTSTGLSLYGLSAVAFYPSAAAMIAGWLSYSQISVFPALDYPHSNIEYYGMPAKAIAIDPSATLVAVAGTYGGDRGPEVTLYDLPLPDAPWTPRASLGERDPVAALAFSSDGSRLYDIGVGTTTSLQIIDHPFRAGTSIDLAGPSLAIGSAGTFTGTLWLGAAHADAGRVLGVEITSPDGHTTLLPTTATDANGVFATTATTTFDQLGDWSVRVTYAGDATHLPGTWLRRFPVRRFSSSLLGALGGPLKAGTSARFSGTLSLEDVTIPPNTTVSVSAVGGDGVTHTIGPVPVGSDGAFSADVPIDQVGDWTIFATYAGDATHDPATSTVTAGAPMLTASLTLSESSRLVTYGGAITFSGTLSAFHTNRTVDLYSIPELGVRIDRPLVYVASALVDDAGRYSITLHPHATGQYFAEYTGDDWAIGTDACRSRPYGACAESRAVTFTIQAAAKISLLGAHGRRGSSFLYRYDRRCGKTARGCPVLALTTTPAIKGVDYVVHVEVLSGRRWLRSGTAEGATSGPGAVLIALGYRGRSVIGRQYRVWVTAKANLVKQGTSTKRYFQIMR